MIFFREKALDAFIRGLDKPLSILLKTASPTSLAKAYQFCLEYENMDCRSYISGNRMNNTSIPIPKPKELSVPFLPVTTPRGNFQVQKPPVPLPRRQPFNNHYNPNQIGNTNTNRSHQMRRDLPVPMEVDESIRSRYTSANPIAIIIPHILIQMHYITQLQAIILYNTAIRILLTNSTNQLKRSHTSTSLILHSTLMLIITSLLTHIRIHYIINTLIAHYHHHHQILIHPQIHPLERETRITHTNEMTYLPNYQTPGKDINTQEQPNHFLGMNNVW